MTETESIIEGEVVEPGTDLEPVAAHEAIMARGELTVDEIVAQKGKVVAIMERVMTPEVHYGRIPGIDKPTLFKPGAEAINVALRLAPDYESEKLIDGNHLTVFSKCVLRHIPTGLTIAAGEGMCSTRESKYATRKAKRTCPDCGAEAIIKGKAEYGGGFVCWRKADPPGCGNKFGEADTRITSQEEGSVENPDLPDLWNTVLKMADKRALIAAVLNGTAASDVFTQDVEDQKPQEAPVAAERRSDVQPVKVPKSWPDIEALARACDNPEEAWPLFQAFVRACSYHLFGEADSAALTTSQKKTVAQKAAGAAVWLREHEDETTDGPYRFYLEPVMRQAWASVLDGAALEIPDYTPPEPPMPEGDEQLLADIAAEVFAEEAEKP